MRKGVVVAVDPAREQDAALEFAVRRAERRDGRVHLVVVAHRGPPGPGSMTELRLEEDELISVTHDALARSARRIAHWTHHLTVTTEVMHGRVVPSLVAASRQADMLVMGHPRMTHRHHPPTLSVTHAVAGQAACPVYAVPDSWHELRDHPEPVIAAVEDEETGRAVVTTAFAEARSVGTAVRILRAWCYPDLTTDEESVLHGTGAEVSEVLRRNTVEALSDLVRLHRDVPCQVDAVHGPPAHSLIVASGRGRLLVVGRHRPSSPWGSHLGPVTRSVLDHSRCPVVVVDVRTLPSYDVRSRQAMPTHSA